MSDVSVVSHASREGGGSTRYIRQGRGETVVLIHGVGMCRVVWAPQIAALARDYDVIAYDMLGHGGSSLPPADARLSDYSDQLLGLMDGLAIGRAHVIGHSMGALIALEFALAHPDRVLGVAALNAVYCRTPDQRRAVLQRAEALETGGAGPLTDGVIARWFGDPVPPELLDASERVRGLLASPNPVGYARTYGLFARSDDAHEGRLEQLAAPALFMTGEADPNSTAAMSRSMAMAAPQGDCHVLTGARHMMAITAPDEVNARLRDFLRSCRERRAAAPAVDTKLFREALGAFVTGVTVVSTLQPDGTPRGFTANSFTSVSLVPPLVLVCVAKSASTYPIVSDAPHFAVSVLAEHQKDVSSLFASKAQDKFSRTRWNAGPGGSPIVEGAAAWFDCRRRQAVDAGDHVILIGEVIGVGHSDASPLGYCRGAYLTFSLAQDAVAAAGHRTRVGAILENDGAVLLVEGPDGRLDLPSGANLTAEGDRDSLREVLRQLGVQAKLNFLFAVFDDPKGESATTSIYYRGTVETGLELDRSLRRVPFSEIPWGRLNNAAVRAMLARFVRERDEDAFGIYVGDAEQGTVTPLASAGPSRLAQAGAGGS